MLCTIHLNLQILSYNAKPRSPSGNRLQSFNDMRLTSAIFTADGALRWSPGGQFPHRVYAASNYYACRAKQREVGVKQIVELPALNMDANGVNLSMSAGLMQSTENNIYLSDYARQGVALRLNFEWVYNEF